MKKWSALIASFLGILMGIGYFLDRTSTPELKPSAVVVSSTAPVSKPYVPYVKPPQSSEEIALLKFLWEGHQLPSTLGEIEPKYGKPISVQVTDPAAAAVTPEDKRWAAGKYNGGVYKNAKYPGLEATYFEHPEGGGPLHNVAISSATYPVMWGIGIGVSTEAVVQRLGKPTDETAELLHYHVLSEGEENGDISFNCRDGKVVKISWSVFID